MIKSLVSNLETFSIRWMAEPADLRSGADVNDTAVEAHTGPSARSADEEEWLDSDGDELGATQLPVSLTASAAVVGLSTQCPTESVNECLLLVTTVAACDDDEDDNGPTEVHNNPPSASEVTLQLLLRVTAVITSAGYAVTTINKLQIQLPSMTALSLCFKGHFLGHLG